MQEHVKKRNRRNGQRAGSALLFDKIEKELAKALEGIGGAVALSTVICLRYKEYSQIVNRRVNPHDYATPWQFRRDYLAANLLRKSDFLPAGIDRREVARQGFFAAEKQCEATNERILSGNISHQTASVLRESRRKMSYILGKLSSDWLHHTGFGPGVDMSARRPRTTAYDKMLSGCATLEASRFLMYAPWTIQKALKLTWSVEKPRVPLTGDTYTPVVIRQGNKVTFVPKDATKERTIAIEPRWNVYFQKGVGTYIRNRLRKFGIDLDDQTRNQSLAAIGSRTGTLATLDLKSASDTIATQLVHEIVDDDWYWLLNSLRSKCYEMDGKSKAYHKFSSMGNGFTFELESAIFFCILWSIVGDYNRISVYGDDLVVPVEYVDEVVTVLRELGFETNGSKSFHSSEFRESCGCDYFMGEFVTPIYVKENPYETCSPADIIAYHNRVFELCARTHGSGFYNVVLLRLCRAISACRDLPAKHRLYGPPSLSGSLTGPRRWWKLLPPPKGVGAGWDGVWLRSTLPVAKKFTPRELDRALAGYWHQSFNGMISIQVISRWKIGKVFVPNGPLRSHWLPD